MTEASQTMPIPPPTPQGAPAPGRPPHPARGGLRRVAAIAASLYLVGIGGLLVAAGQADDSPGLGGLGLINGLIGLCWLVDTLRRAGR